MPSCCCSGSHRALFVVPLLVAALIALVAAGPGRDDKAAGGTQTGGDTKKAWTDPYPLDTCPVSGETLLVGASVTRDFDGREFRFCCEKCVAAFESKKAELTAKVDAEIIKRQAPLYPTDTCIVLGEKLVEEESDKPVDYVHNNRLIRFCCKPCIGKFKKDPAAFLKKLDAMVAEKQAKSYPTTTCIVSGKALGADAHNVVMAGRLIRLCCKECEKSLRAEAPKHLVALEKATKDAAKTGR